MATGETQTFTVDTTTQTETLPDELTPDEQESLKVGEEISEQQQAELDAMTMSNTVPPHYLINGTGNSQLDGFLQDRNCPYYHEQHWGKEVYMYSPTRGDFKDT